MKKIYNEGRVVGYSAYEIYKRQALSEDPNHTPASEREWLASTVAMGSSMIVNIPKDNTSGHHYVDISFPKDTELSAANTIIGSLFLGQVSLNGRWAVKVTDYGPLLYNTANYPTPGKHTSNSTEYPTTSQLTSELNSNYQNQLKEYMKVVDAIIIQPGTWKSTTHGEPPKDFLPDLSISATPRLRIYFSDKINNSFNLLLTGFTLRTTLKGVSGLDGSTDTYTNSPEDGAFLGPAVYPWANKVIFSVPPSYINYYLDNKYSRKIARESVAKEVKSVPVIDMESTDPGDYYETNHSDSRINLTVVDINKVNGDSVLTVYQRDAAFPPALFGTKSNSVESNHLNPIDTVAPGTIKLLEGKDEETLNKSRSFQSSIPNNYALSRDQDDYVLKQLDNTSSNSNDWSHIPVADTFISPIYGTLSSSEPISPFFHTQHNAGDPGSYQGIGVSMSRRISGTLSDRFREEFGIDPIEDKNLLDALLNLSYTVSSTVTSSINKSMYNMVVNNHPNDWKTKFYFILQLIQPTYANATYISNIVIIPVFKESNRVDYIDKLGGIDCNLPFLIPPSSDSFNQNNAKYLGTWWDSEHIPGHISISEYLSSIGIEPAALQDPTRSLPMGDNSHDWQWLYKNTKLSDIFSDAQLNGYTQDYEGSRTTYTKINQAYRKLTLSELLEKGKFYNLETGRQKSGGFVFTKYFAKKGSISYSDYGLSISDSINMTVSIKETSPKSVAIPIPNGYVSDKGPQSVINTAGYHQTKSLSIASSSGEYYNMLGTDGSITDMRDGSIHWDDILRALVENKSIDILHSPFFVNRFVELFQSDITAGNGISVTYNKDKGKFTITNTMPYNIAGLGYTRINQVDTDQEDGFIVKAYNGFKSFNYSTKEFEDGIKLGLRILPSEDKDEDGDPSSVSLIIDSIYTDGGNDYRLGKPKFDSQNSNLGFYWPSSNAIKKARSEGKSDPKAGFAFRHSDKLDSKNVINTGNEINPYYRYSYGQLSHIFGIKFTGKYSYLNKDKYQFRNTTESGSGIWNILKENEQGNGEPCGGSWMAMGGLATSKSGGRDDSTIIAFVSSYADGYNDQLNIWDKDTSDETGRGKNLYSEYMNFTVSGIFYQK